MPNRLRANAMVWLYFTNDMEAKKGTCLYCGRIISYEKSTFSNLARHLKRKHANLLKNEAKSIKAMQQLQHYIWNHFSKKSDGKVKCAYCHTYLSCPTNMVSNLMRHMKAKHPQIPLEEQLEYIHPDDNRMLNESQLLDDEIEESFKASASLHESEELDMESNLNSIELMADDDVSDSVKIEYEHCDLDARGHEDDQEVIEEIVQDTESQHNVDIECFETNATSQIASSSYTQPNQETVEAPQETVAGTSDQNIRTQSGPIFSLGNVTDSGSHNFLSDIHNVNVRTAAYATNIALELDSIQSRQRIIAEKLIADVLFNAKLDYLTEHSMVLARLNHPSAN